MSAFGGKADIVTSSRDAHTIVISRLRSGAKIVFGIRAWTPRTMSTNLRHAEAHGNAAQCVGVKLADLRLGCQKLDRMARRHRHRRIEILIEPDDDPM